MRNKTAPDNPGLPVALQNLLAQGKARGLLTFDEISELPREIDDLLELLAQEDIEIVDEVKEPDAKEEAEDFRQTSCPPDPWPEEVPPDDPVRMYLKEIGRVDLLTRQEEVELAQRMEKGEEALSKLLRMDPLWGASVRQTPSSSDEDLPVRRSGGVVLRARQGAPGTSAEGRQESDPDGKISQKQARPLGSIQKLEKVLSEGREAKRKLVEANLRLVVSVAKKYLSRGVLFLDLIQEGNLGLIRAAEKFNYRKGFKFSTYATWWIRQAITRALADQGRTIRIPVHMVETINRLTRVSRHLLQELGRDPSVEEIASEMYPVDLEEVRQLVFRQYGGEPGLDDDLVQQEIRQRKKSTEERVREIMKIAQEPISLEAPIGEEADAHLVDIIEDAGAVTPAEAACAHDLHLRLQEQLANLNDREKEVIRARFGLDDRRPRTLEEVGQELGVTRERIRQIEASALRKLRSLSKWLRDYLEL